MRGDVRITLSVRIVGQKEPLVGMDTESDSAAACIQLARICLLQAEAKLADREVSREC